MRRFVLCVIVTVLLGGLGLFCYRVGGMYFDYLKVVAIVGPLPQFAQRLISLSVVRQELASMKEVNARLDVARQEEGAALHATVLAHSKTIADLQSEVVTFKDISAQARERVERIEHRVRRAEERVANSSRDMHSALTQVNDVAARFDALQSELTDTRRALADTPLSSCDDFVAERLRIQSALHELERWKELDRRDRRASFDNAQEMRVIIQNRIVLYNLFASRFNARVVELRQNKPVSFPLSFHYVQLLDRQGEEKND